MQHDQQDDEFSVKSLFIPLTIFKAIHIIVITGLIVFFNIFFNGFVWDDRSYILENPEVHSITNVFNQFGQSVFNNAGQYRPLVATYFTILYSMFGSVAFFYHFIQVIIHIVNSVLLFLLFRTFFKNAFALILSLIFLVHPIQVESVAFIGASGNVLFFLFGVLALLIAKKDVMRKKHFVLISFFLLLSLLTKETGICFLMLILLYSYIFKKNISQPSLLFSIFTPFFIYLFLRVGVAGIDLTKRLAIPIANLDLGQRLINVPEMFLYYIKAFFFPLQLSINQQWVVTDITVSTFYLPLLLSIIFLVLLLFVGIFAWRTTYFKPYLFFLIWFFVGMSLHLQIIPLDMTVADRWFYFPIVGLLGFIGLVSQRFLHAHLKFRKWFIAFSIVLVVILAIKTVDRNADWYDEITLYNHDKQYHDNFDIQNNLAIAYSEKGEYKLAIEAAQKSIHFFPSDLNYYTLGNIYEKMGDSENAIQAYTQALKQKNYVPWEHKHYLQLYTNLCRLYALHDTPAKAKECAEMALQDWPDAVGLWIFLAVMNDKLGNHDAAIKAAQTAYTLSPNELTADTYIKLQRNEKLEFFNSE